MIFQRVVLSLILCFSFELLAASKDVLDAIHGLEAINGFPAEPELLSLGPAYDALPAAPDVATARSLFEKQRIASWSGTLSEFISLSDILFASLSPEEQDTLRPDFDRYSAVLHRFQKDITDYVLKIHPGFPVDWDSLRQQNRGRGVRVAVFDVFDPELLDRQSQTAFIQKPLVFGNPVALPHGNSVIDIILALAPEVEIIPIWSDAKSYAVAMKYLAGQPDIDLLNMSRAFPEQVGTRQLDPDFAQALLRFTSHSLLFKALGNTGSDLFGKLNRRRVDDQLGPVNNIASYDLKLIRDYAALDPNFSFFAINLTLFSDDIALTATVPGDLTAIQERSLAVPAEGVFSPSSGTFESGSSFAAPQLTALAALYLEQRRRDYPDESPASGRGFAAQALQASAERGSHTAAEWGLGRP